MNKLNNTTWGRIKVPNPNRFIDFEVRDIQQAQFFPQFKTKHWNNECNFSLRLKEDDYSGASVQKIGQKIEWTKGNKKARIYEIDGFEDGGIEFEVEFATKPATNIVEFTLETKELDFFFQAPYNEQPLYQEDINAGVITRTETKGLNAQGDVVVEIPINVINSYAVYHKTKGRMHRSAGHEYRVGKAFHIYRPHAVDDNGVETWCDLHINEETGILKVTIPQEFLDSAVYPVIVDPTIGYTTLGSTTFSASAGDIWGSVVSNTMPETGVADSISFGVNGFGLSTERCVGAIYDESNASALLSPQTVENTGVAGDNSSHFETMAFTATGPTLTVGNAYAPTGYTNAVYNILRDAGAGTNTRVRQTGITYPSWPDPAGFSADSSNRYSVYATYTASGGGSTPGNTTQFLQLLDLGT